MDKINLSRNVMFVGDYFTLITTIVLDNELRNEDETETEFAIRSASVFLKAHYGIDFASISNSIGVIGEDGEEDYE